MSITKEGAEAFNAAMEKLYAGEETQEPSGDALPVEQEAQPEQEEEIREEPTETQEVTEEPVAKEQTEEPQEEEKPDEMVSVSFGEDYTPEETPEAFKTEIESLKNKIEELESSKTNVFANEQVERINEYVRNGGELNESFFKAQSLDVSVDYASENSMLNAVKNKYMLIDGLSDEEATHLMKRKYGSLFEDREDVDEVDIKSAMLDLKMDARGVEPHLKEYKKRSDIPVQDPKAVEQQEKEYQKYITETSQRLSQVTKFQFDLADDFPIEVKVDKNSHDYISSLLLKPENLISYFKDNYVVEDKLDVEKFAKDQFVLRNYQNLIKTATAQGESRGQKKFAQQELRQENLDGSKAKTASPSDATVNWQKNFFSTAKNNNLIN